MKVVIVFFVLILSGCATGAFYQSASSGQIGCAENEIVVSNLNSSLRGQTWVAECKGKKYFCNSTSSTGMGSNQVNCKAEQI